MNFRNNFLKRNLKNVKIFIDSRLTLRSVFNLKGRFNPRNACVLCFVNLFGVAKLR